MKASLTLVLLVALCPLALGLQSLDNLNTEFKSESDLESWNWLHKKQGHAPKLLSATIKESTLIIEPNTSAWYADFQAPYLFKTVNGNFDIAARVEVSGKNSPGPEALWSLGGLMVRRPNGLTKSSWKEGCENWLFLTTGVADPNTIPVFETKTTIGSRSVLKLRPAKTGWVTLRIIRIDNTFVLLYKHDGDNWTILERFYRTDLPPNLQVGLVAYTDFYSAGSLTRNAKQFNETVIENGKPDMVMKVDYIKASKPNLSQLNSLNKGQLSKLQHWTPGNLLSDYALTNQEVLNLLGIRP